MTNSSTPSPWLQHPSLTNAGDNKHAIIESDGHNILSTDSQLTTMHRPPSSISLNCDCTNVNQQSNENYGHFFVKKSFHKPTYCHHCVEMLWGLIGQGYYCEVCNFICHERCRKLVISPCSSIAPILIKVNLQFFVFFLREEFIERKPYFVFIRIPCAIFGRIYPGLNVNFAMSVENDWKIFPLYDVKVSSSKRLILRHISIILLYYYSERKQNNIQVIDSNKFY